MMVHMYTAVHVHVYSQQASPVNIILLMPNSDICSSGDDMIPSVRVHACKECDKEYESRSGLRRHVLSKHSLQATTQPIQCREEECTFTCRCLNALRDHLKEHGIKTEMETMTFTSLQGAVHVHVCICMNTLFIMVNETFLLVIYVHVCTQTLYMYSMNILVPVYLIV